MGPKKIDPETREKDYEAYKEMEEYKKIEEIHDQIKINLHPFISQTSRDYDLNGKYQNLWDLIYELSILMKIKPPFKKIEHQWLRSIYFGEKRKADKNDPPYLLDGVLCEFQPVDADAQHHLRQALIKKITNIAGEKDNFDLENYSKSRSDLKKGITELYGLLKSYSKKSFKVIYEEKFMEVLKPFSDLLEVNMKLVLFDLRYTTDDEKYINSFKKKAINQRYCECLQKILQILMTFQNKPISQKISPSNMFKKLNYENLSKIEQFYLHPFSTSFDNMKKGLCALFTTGINFWKVPVEENKKFVDDLKVLVNWELVCERHFGNSLVRDQINFIAEALASIDKANDLSRKYMIQKDPNCIQIAIPRLVAFKTIQHMRNYKDKQYEMIKKEEQKKKNTGSLMNSIMDNSEELRSTGIQSHLKNGKGEGLEKTKGSLKRSPSKAVNKENFNFEKNDFGRYWIWENYCDDEFRDKVIEQAVQKLQHINKAVQQDIEDTIVREGMLPRKDRHDEERISAADTLKNMKTYHNADKGENMRRPPELWNYSKVIESIADPKKCYVDGRIEDLNALLVKIGNYLMSHNRRNWNELVKRVIDFYDGNANSNPAFDDT